MFDDKEFKLHKFIMIEIIDDMKVQQHFSFTHPKYETEQFLYFNKKMDLMIEWLFDNHVCLYQRQIVGKDAENPKILSFKWTKLRRMNYLNQNFGGRRHFLEHVSPDFKYFLDVDLARKVFIIRDIFTEEEINVIPRYLMDIKKDQSSQRISEIVMRFKWVGNDMFKIINQSGMEKLVDVGTDFKQEQFNKIQNFNYEEEKNRNYYFDRLPLEPKQVLQRLVRKSQNYKSA